MSRLYHSLLLLGVLGAFTGCHHVAGICDCQPDSYCGCHCAHIAAHGDHAGPVEMPATIATPTTVPLAAPITPAPTTGVDLKMLPTPPAGAAPKFN